MSELTIANGWWEKNHISPSKLSTWTDCQMKFWFRYVQGLRKPPKIWLPQGTAVHIGVEDLLEDLPKGNLKPLEEYTFRAREQWEQECAKSGVYTGKGDLMTGEALERAFDDAMYWLQGFYDAVKDGGLIDGFDVREVAETEIDAIREVKWPGGWDLGELYVRGKIDWVVATDGPVARLADLKTASPSFGWDPSKAHSQVQATAYGFLTGKPTTFDYIVIPKESKYTKSGNLRDNPKKATPYRIATKRHEFHYEMLMHQLRDFVLLSDVHNDYANFHPFPNHTPGKWGSWCGHLCDFQAECRKMHGM